ncbi:MAG TPA: hypothetical protein VGX76_05115, partial [Pirellulales bacterium]|nr:hypothetical protein [Pirellulales bacterium]
MDLEYAMFANNAAPLGDGRLCIFGADFDGVRSDVFPCVVPPFVLIVKMRLNVGENPSGHTLRIELVNPNGEGHVVNESPIAAAPNDQRADLPSNAQV